MELCVGISTLDMCNTINFEYILLLFNMAKSVYPIYIQKSSSSRVGEVSLTYSPVVFRSCVKCTSLQGNPMSSGEMQFDLTNCVFRGVLYNSLHKSKSRFVSPRIMLRTDEANFNHYLFLLPTMSPKGRVIIKKEQHHLSTLHVLHTEGRSYS